MRTKRVLWEGGALPPLRCSEMGTERQGAVSRIPQKEDILEPRSTGPNKMSQELALIV